MKLSLRVLAAVMAIVMTVCAVPMFALAAASRFTDFPAGTWSAPALNAAVANGLMKGKDENTLAPKDYITRAETAAMINRAFGATIKADISSYKDVDASQWYYAEMQKSVNMQTIVGVSATELDPTGYITRESVFTILGRALVLSDTDETKLMSFEDGASVSAWARSYTAALVNRSYVNGNEKNQLKPQDYITREEFAQLMHNLFKVYIDSTDNLPEVIEGNAIVRVPGLTLKNLVINGDLIVADGVGNGTITLDNVKVSGRILFRGGEGGVRIESNCSVGDHVIVHDVNGVVKFLNYVTDIVFDDHIQSTDATFLEKKPGVSGGSSGGSGGGSNYATYKITEYVQNVTDIPGGAKTYTSTTTTYTDKRNIIVSYTPAAKTGFTIGASLTSGINNGTLELYAYYDRNQIAISFNGTDYDFLYGQKLFDNTALKQAMDAYAAAQVLAGYNVTYKYGDGTAINLTADTADVAKTIVAERQAIVYNINYNLGAGESFDSTQTVTYTYTVEDEVILPTPTKADHAFLGWYTEDTLQNYIPKIEVGTTGHLNLWPRWAPEGDVYEITLDNTSYDVAAGKTIGEVDELADALRAIAANVPNGYEIIFKITYDNNVTVDDMTLDEMLGYRPYGNATIEYEQKIITYTITYMSNGVEITVAGAPISYNVTTPTFTIPRLSDTSSHYFMGWNLNGTPVTQITQGTTGNLVLTANWNIRTYTASFNGNTYNFNHYDKLSQAPGLEAALRAAIPTAEGYTVEIKATYMSNGSLTDFVGTVDEVLNLVPNANVTITVSVVAIPYSITYMSNGSAITHAPASYTVDTLPVDLVALSDTETHLFKGWYDNATFTGNEITQITSGTGALTFYAKWEPRTYEVTYGGSVVGTITYGETLSAVDGLQATLGALTPNNGYSLVFVVSKTADNTEVTRGTLDQILAYGPAANVTITVEQAPIGYTIEYYSEGAQITPSGAIYGYNIETPTFALPVLGDTTSHLFKGWYNNPEFSGDAVTEVAEGTYGNLKFYANWELRKYTATFNGVPYTFEHYDGLSEAGALETVLRAVEEKPGYERVFTATYTPAEDALSLLAEPVTVTGTIEEILALAPNADVVITVGYELIPYSIKYYSEGVEITPEGAVTGYNIETGTFDLPVLPDTETHRFGGWYKDAALTNGAYWSIATGTYGDLELHANWIEKEKAILEFVPNVDYDANTVTLSVKLSGLPYDIEDLASATIHYTQTPGLLKYEGATAAFDGSFSHSEGVLSWFNDTTAIDADALAAKGGVLFTITYSFTDDTEGDVVFAFKDTTELTSSQEQGFKIAKGYVAIGTNVAITKAPAENAILAFSPNVDYNAKTVTLNVTLSDIPYDIEDLASATIFYTQTPALLKYEGASAAFGGSFSHSEGVLSWYNDATAIDSDALAANDGVLFTITYSFDADTEGEVEFAFASTELTSSFDYGFKIARGYETKGSKVTISKTAFIVTFDGTDYDVLHNNSLASNAQLKTALEAVTAPDGYKVVYKASTSTDEYTLEGILAFVPTANTVIEYALVPIDYTITYMSDGEAITPDGAVTEYNIETETFSLPVLDDTEDYIFDGWYNNPEFAGEEITEVAKGTMGNLTFYANWVHKEYAELTFVPTVDYDAKTVTLDVTLNKLPYDINDLAAATVYYTASSDIVKYEGASAAFGGSFSHSEGVLSWYNDTTAVDAAALAANGGVLFTITYSFDANAEGEVAFAFKSTTELTSSFAQGFKIAKGYKAIDTTVNIAKGAIYTLSLYRGTNEKVHEYQVPAGGFITQAQIDEKLGDPANYKTAKGYTDSDGKVHEVYPELWYMDGTEWKIFDPETVAVVSDMKVYLVTRYLSFVYNTDLSIKGIDIPEIKVTIPYDSNTHIGQSALDILNDVRRAINNALGLIKTQGVDVYQLLLEKAAKSKLVDENGNILNLNIPIPLHRLLTEDLIMNEIDKYIEQNINDEEFIAEILRNDTVVETLLADESIRKEVLSDESMRDKLLTDSVIKKLIGNETVIDFIFNSTDFKQEFVNNDKTFDYIIKDLKELLSNETYHDMIIDACVDFVIDVYFEGTKTSDALVNYIDEVLGDDKFIAEIEANKQLRPMFKEEVKDLIAELADRDAEDETKKEVYDEIRGNATIKQSIIDSVINNDDIMDSLMNEVREDLKKDASESQYRALVIEVVESEFNDPTSTLKADIINSVKTDLEKSDSTLRADVAAAVSEDLAKGEQSTLKPDLIEAIKKDLGYATDEDASTVSKLKDKIITAIKGEFSKDQSDLKDKVIATVKGEFAKAQSDLKDKVIAAIKGEFDKDQSDFADKVVTAIKGEFDKDESELKDKIITTIKGEFEKTQSDLKDKVITAIKGEFEKTQSDLKDKIITAIKGEFDKDESDLKDKVITAIKGEFDKDQSELKDKILTAVQNDFNDPDSTLKDKIIAAVELDFNDPDSTLKAEIIAKVETEIKNETSELRASILGQLADADSEVAMQVKGYVKGDNADLKAEIKTTAKENTEVQTAAKDWINTNYSLVSDKIKDAAIVNVDALTIAILNTGYTADDAEAEGYARDYISDALDLNVRQEIEDEINNFFANDADVIAMINDNFITFYNASYDKIFDDLYADETVFERAYESYIAIGGKLEEAFDKYIDTNSDNLTAAVDAFVSVDGKLEEAINTYVKDSDSLSKAVDVYVSDPNRLSEAVDFYVEDDTRLNEAVDFYVDDDTRLNEAIDFYVEDDGRLSEAVDFYIDDDGRLNDAIDFYIEDEDRLNDAIDTYLDVATDEDIEKAIDTFIADDNRLITAVNKYIEDSDKLESVFDIVKGDSDDLMEAFDLYIKEDANLDKAFKEFAADGEAFDKFYEEHLGENADDPELFNTLFEAYYHDHVHDVAKSAYEESAPYKDYVSNPEDPKNDENLSKKELYELIMDYVFEYTEELVEDYADGTLENSHPELVETIDDLMHKDFPAYVREEYAIEGSEIRNTVDTLIEEEGRKLIDDYVNGKITDTDTLDFIDSTIDENITSIIDDYVDDKLRDDIKKLVDDEIDTYMTNLVNDYINDVGDARETLGELIPTYAQDAVDALKDTDAFKNLIKQITTTNMVTVNKDNRMFVEIVSEFVEDFDYESIVDQFIPARVKSLLDKVGGDLASKYVNSVINELKGNMNEALDKLNADIENGIEDTSYDFNTTATLKVNYMKDIIAPYYTKVEDKIRAKVSSVATTHLDKNEYAKRLVDTKLLYLLVDDANNADETMSGYKLKNSIIEYYDGFMEIAVLLHDAVVWYNTQTEMEIESRVDAASALIGTYLGKLNDVIMAYIEDGELPKGYTKDDLISKLTSLFDKLNGKVSALDKVESQEERIEKIADKLLNFYEERLDKDYKSTIDLANMSIYANGKAYPLYQIMLEMTDEAFDVDDVADAFYDSANYHNVSKIESAMAKVQNKIDQHKVKDPVPTSPRFIVSLHRGILNNRTLRGRDTGTHTGEIERYLTYIR